MTNVMQLKCATQGTITNELNPDNKKCISITFLSLTCNTFRCCAS